MSRTLELTWHLVKRDFQLRHAGSQLGVLWSLAIPLSQLLILVFVFGRVIPLNIANYPVFVFIALLPWTWFSSSLMGSSSAFISARDLLRYPSFPPAVIIGVNTAAHLLTFALSLPVLFGMMYWYGIDFPWMFLSAFPLLLLIQGTLIMGLSFIVATANVFYRDISPLTSLVISLLFFLTPIWYSPETKGEYGFLFQINPISLIVQNYRRVLLDGQSLDWPSVTTAALISIAFLLVGYLMFRHLQSEIVDTI